MSLGKCLTYGMGGFGKFASLISPYSTTCSAIHMTATQSTPCAVPRAELRLTRGIRKRKRKKQHIGEDGTQLFLPPMPKLKADLETAAAIKKKRIVVSRVQQTIQKEKPFPPMSGSPPSTLCVLPGGCFRGNICLQKDFCTCSGGCTPGIPNSTSRSRSASPHFPCSQCGSDITYSLNLW